MLKLLTCALFVLFLCQFALSCEETININVKKFSDSSNSFETFPLSSPELKNAFKIVISDQIISTLCPNAFNDLNMETIEISNNKIEKIQPGAFGNLKYLSNLILVNNGLKEISEGVFKDLNIRKLNLSHNVIEKIDSKAFNHMEKLDVLDLSHNKIKSLDVNWFKTNSKLGWLILDHNQIEEIPEGFISFSVMHEVGLDIFIRNNRVKAVKTGAIQNVKIIRTLFLSDNKLKTIPINMFKDVKTVKTLFLDNNDITCLDELVLNGLKIVHEVHFQGNLILCDCLKQMKTWGKTNGVEIKVLSRSVECFQDRITNLRKNYAT